MFSLKVLKNFGRVISGFLIMGIFILTAVSAVSGINWLLKNDYTVIVISIIVLGTLIFFYWMAYLISDDI